MDYQLDSADEIERQAAVDEVLLTHPELEPAFNLLTHVITTRLGVPMSTITLVDRDRLFFPAHTGIDVDEAPRHNSFCGRAILQDKIFTLSDARADPDFRDSGLVTGDIRMRFYAGAPVHAPNGLIVGTINAIDTEARELTPAMQETLSDLRDIAESLLKLLAMAARDHLTGLSNRRCFDETLDREWHRSCRARLPVALVCIDIDFFKDYNDRFGHQAGDTCLYQVARTMLSVCKRSGDVPFRVGGEEFVILLTMTSGQKGALEFAEELQHAIEALALEHPSSPFGVLTASMGVVVADSASLPEDGSRLEEFVKIGDEALYTAKSRGRNCIVLEHFVESIELA